MIGIENAKDIREILRNPRWRLSFPPLLEQEFKAFYAKTFIKQMRAAIIIGLILLTCCGLLDLFFAPYGEMIVLTRIVFVMPVLGIITFFAFSDKFKIYQQSTLIIFIAILFLDITWIGYDLRRPYEDLYYNGVILIEIFLLTVARVRFTYGFILLLSLYFVYNFSLLMEQYHPISVLFIHNYLYLSAAVLGLLGNYTMERVIRETFLQRELIRLDSELLEKTNRDLRELAIHDGLTGLLNHRYFHEKLETEWRRAERHQYPLTLIMLDVDYFKEYNDTYGHQAGDIALQRLATVLKYIGRRPGDLAARYGGDEFTLLLVGANQPGAEYIAKLIIDLLAQQMIEHSASKASQYMTVSIGAATITPQLGSDCSEMVHQADAALYKAKANGRNCYMLS